MTCVQLKFDSLLNLWCFKEKVQPAAVEIVMSKNLLICELPDDAIRMAVQDYNARVYDQPVFNAPTGPVQ